MIRKPKFMNDTVKKLQHNYKAACDAYLHRFCELIEMDIHYADWVDIGGLAEIGDYYVGMQDIITAVEHNVGYEPFIKWYDYNLRCGGLDLHTCNLESWLRGCPTYSEKQLRDIEVVLERMQKDQEELDRLIIEAKEAI